MCRYSCSYLQHKYFFSFIVGIMLTEQILIIDLYIYFVLFCYTVLT